MATGVLESAALETAGRSRTPVLANSGWFDDNDDSGTDGRERCAECVRSAVCLRKTSFPVVPAFPMKWILVELWPHAKTVSVEDMQDRGLREALA